MNREIIPYRENVDVLLEEIAKLQRENAKLRQQSTSELVYSWSESNASCRLCGKYREALSWHDEFGNSLDLPRKERIACLTQEWEEPYNPSWIKRLLGSKARPGRMRRTCEYCRGTYYELPKECCNET